MTTARTHKTQVNVTARSLGTPRARIATPKPDNFVPVGVDADGALISQPGSDGVQLESRVGDFDPAEFNIDEVKEYVGNHPDEAQAVLDQERIGKDRSTLVEWLESHVEGDN